jgi:hypothetical protein
MPNGRGLLAAAASIVRIVTTMRVTRPRLRMTRSKFSLRSTSYHVKRVSQVQDQKQAVMQRTTNRGRGLIIQMMNKLELLRAALGSSNKTCWASSVLGLPMTKPIV